MKGHLIVTDETAWQVKTIGVAGAGTMGAGIAQVAAEHGFEVALFDAAPGQAERAVSRIAERLSRAANNGRITTEQASVALRRVAVVEELDGLAAVDFAIEAAPEELELKRQLFARLGDICAPDTILASNTSSLSISSIAAAASLPHRVVGMHFFNPVPVMALVEVIAGVASSDTALARTEELARRLGKTPLRVHDTPGFVVNRVARPYYGEALRIVAEGSASAPEVDRIMRAYGFALGPFELLDLIGIEVNLAVTRTIYEGTFHEPRYRPHPLQVRKVEAGELGRKTGRGFYRYGDGQPSRPVPAAPAIPRPGSPLPTSVLLAGQGPVADDMALALAAAGQQVTIYAGEVSPAIEQAGIPRAQRLSEALSPIGIAIEATVGPPELKRAYWYELDDALPPETPILTCGLARGITEVASWSARPERVVGFGFAGAFASAPLVEVARGDRSAGAAVDRAVTFFQDVEKEVALVGDPPGQVAPRMLAMLVNEACFALGDGITSGQDIDTGLRLGLNFPRGALGWSDVMGLDTIVAILDGLHAYFGDERYRVAPVLRRALHAGRSLLE